MESLVSLFKTWRSVPKPKNSHELVQHVVEMMIIVQKYQHQMLRHGHSTEERSKDDAEWVEIQKAQEQLAKEIAQMRETLALRGDGEGGQEYKTLSVKIAEKGMMQVLVRQIGLIDFETKKDVARLFTELLKAPCPGGFTIQYVGDHFEELVGVLLQGYRLVEFSSYCCGQMVRECVQSADLTRKTLYSPFLDELFEAAQLEQFDIATHAFVTLQLLLTTHKKTVAAFLEEEYESFFPKYTKLLTSSSYATKRQSLRMLGSLLLDRTNFSVMIRYISDEGNLKLVMNLMRERSEAIQLDAFQVFKVFVGNPDKGEAVTAILRKNSAKLRTFIAGTLKGDPSDDEFKEDRQAVLDEIGRLASEQNVQAAAAPRAAPAQHAEAPAG